MATYPKPKPQSRKVILEYSSDENVDQQVPGVELGKPKRVKKRITLTLPTKPTNVTLTASFHQFFIRHGMNRALRKALESKKWTLDQMQQFQANYTAKHGTKIPPPKLYMDEGDSEEEGLELKDGTIYGRQTGTGGKPKPPGGSGGSGRGSGRGSGAGRGAGRGTGGTGGTGEPVVVAAAAVAAAVVAAVVVVAPRTIHQGTLQRTLTKAESVTVKRRRRRTTLRKRSLNQILLKERVHDRSEANPVVAKAPLVASSPEIETYSILDHVERMTRHIHQWMTRSRCSTSTEQKRHPN